MELVQGLAEEVQRAQVAQGQGEETLEVELECGEV